MKKCICIVDANNFAFANFHVHQNLHTQEGVPTGLLYGALEGLLRLSRLFDKSPIVMVWDGPGMSWRKKLSPHRYKAQRNTTGETRENCMEQINKLIVLLDEFEILQLRLPDTEADDVIAILSQEFQKDFDTVVIRSSDKDFYQLVSPQVKILRGQLSNNEKSKPVTPANVWSHLIDEKYVRDTFNVSPSRWTVFRALTGDSSDNLRGLVKGAGEVAAAQIVASGLKLPAFDCPVIQKISRLRNTEITKNDWERVNENYVLSNLVLSYQDKRIPLDAQKEIEKFLTYLRSMDFKRTVKASDWKLARLLGSYELSSLAGQVWDLIRLY